MRIKDICSRDPVTVSPAATLAEVAQLMRDRNVGAVIVTKAPVEAPVPVGIVTDRDIALAQLDRRADLGSLCVADAMTRDPLTVNEGDSLSTAIARMRARGVRRAPVLSAHGALVGMVSTDDLLPVVARSLSHLARVVSVQPRQEAGVVPLARTAGAL